MFWKWRRKPRASNTTSAPGTTSTTLRTATPTVPESAPGAASTSLRTSVSVVSESDPHRFSSSGRVAGATGLERVGPVQEVSNHHYGHTYHTTNTSHGSGPAYFINHVENAAFGVNADLLALDSLLPRHPPISNSKNEYLPNSRSEDEKAIWNWIRNPVAALVLWIHGPAGSGKSTLAQHIQQQLQSQGRLAAAVFLSAFRPNLPSPEIIIRLIAGELGRIHNKANSTIVEAIRRCHAAPSQTLVKSLILDAVRSLQLQHPLIVVLDAADEWPSHGAFIEALSCLDTSLIRFIILGRLEPQGKAFQNLSIKLHALLQVSNEVMQGYLNWRLDQVEWEPGTKPSSYDVTRLSEKADGLFVWAVTACSLLEDKLSPSSPRDTLAAILRSHHSLGESNDLARLYLSAIMLLFPKPEDRNTVRAFLGAVMVLQEPLPFSAFSSLVGIRPPVIKEVQTRLKALQIRQPHDADRMVHPAGSSFHLSLIEFFQSTSAGATLTLSISTFDSHAAFARVCLQELVRFPPTTQDLNSLYVSPLRLYVVNYLALHLSGGAPEVTPGSASDWEASQLCSTLRKAPISAFYQWGTLLLQLVQPGSKMPKKTYNDTEKGLLMLDVARSLTSGGNLQPLRISCLGVAVRLLPDDGTVWSDLGSAYSALAENSMASDAPLLAVAAYRSALEASIKSDVTERGPALVSLAGALFTSFGRFGTMGNLYEAVDLTRDALSLRPHGHPNRSMTLDNLAICLQSQYETAGSKGDLLEATELHREALSLQPHGHPNRSSTLNNLANCLQLQYETAGSKGDLLEATELHREALSLRPHGHPNRSWTLNNLANCLQSQYETAGSKGDLLEATELHREALSLQPHGHPNRSWTLNNLANCLQSQYETAGSKGDLLEATELHREALSLRPHGHPNRSWTLNNLANCLQSQYETAGSKGDLLEATELHREALSLRPHGHPNRSITLYDLANTLNSRYEAEGSKDDLREAMELNRNALLLMPHGNPNRSKALTGLAACLQLRYKMAGSNDDLREAISLYRDAVRLRPLGHPLRSSSLENLSTALYLAGTEDDLREAASLRKTH